MSGHKPFFTVRCVSCGDVITVGISQRELLSQCDKCNEKLERALREARELLAHGGLR